MTFSAFEYVAKQEAGGNISDRAIQKLKSKLNDRNIWEISNSSGYLTIFYYSESQALKNTDIIERVRNEFFEIISPYNEFNYFTKDNLFIFLDSKENFDNNYDSNWYYYYK